MSQNELRGVVVLTRVIDASNSEVEFVRVGTIDECQQWYTSQWEQIIKLHPDLNVLPYVGKSQFYRMAQFNRAGGEALFMLHEYHERHFLYAKYIEAAGAQQPSPAEAADDLSELEQALNANAALQARVEQLERERAQLITDLKNATYNSSVYEDTLDDIDTATAAWFQDDTLASVREVVSEHAALKALLQEAAQVIAPFAEADRHPASRMNPKTTPLLIKDKVLGNEMTRRIGITVSHLRAAFAFAAKLAARK